MSGQKHNGTTVNATVSMDGQGVVTYGFNSPFDVSVSLTTVTGVIVTGSANNDAFFLGASTSDVINGGNGNDSFFTASTATDLGGNVIHGGTGIDTIRLGGSGQSIDLTGKAAGTAATTGIDAVVAKAGLSGESVTLTSGQMSTTAISNGSTGHAFTALLGTDGTVNLTLDGKTALVGEVDGAGNAYAADGVTQLTGAAASALISESTSITAAEGTFYADRFGGNPAKQSAKKVAADPLIGYVFSTGSAYYTLWTDGTVTTSTTGPNAVTTTLTAAPAATVDVTTFGSFTQFSKADSATGVLATNSAGQTTLLLKDGSTLAYDAIIVGNVSNTVVHGDSGGNGGDWFGLQNSAGGNTLFGSPNDNVFDLQKATALVDTIHGGSNTGFNVVVAKASGADVDLTGASTTGKIDTQISAVVSGVNNAGTQTVELDVGSLVATTVGGTKSAEFEAMLGGAGATLTLSGKGDWVEVGSFAAGATPLTGAAALQDASILDALYADPKKQYTAESQLTGYLFEQVNSQGAVTKYLTVYTDATIVSDLAAPKVAPLVQAAAALGAASASSASLSTSAAATPALLLAASHG